MNSSLRFTITGICRKTLFRKGTSVQFSSLSHKWLRSAMMKARFCSTEAGIQKQYSRGRHRRILNSPSWEMLQLTPCAHILPFCATFAYNLPFDLQISPIFPFSQYSSFSYSPFQTLPRPLPNEMDWYFSSPPFGGCGERLPLSASGHWIGLCIWSWNIYLFFDLSAVYSLFCLICNSSLWEDLGLLCETYVCI